MSDVIKLLPDSIANQIAAGEVIQRPASAVKELLENALDAGATHIQLYIKDAGKALIQVIDNGCGMSDTDARMSFERHATSKIQNIEDLFSIRTMGFRGEALASIAAVAQVEMKSQKASDELGTEILIEGSDVLKQETIKTNAGTSIAVKNLFYNVPARRQFLKSNPVETRHIIDEFTRVAMAQPQIHFEMHQNGNEVFNLRRGTLKQRIVGLLGKDLDDKLVPTEEQTSVVHISGYVGKPAAARKTRGDQFFFVNNRFIKSNYLHHAISSMFSDLMPRDFFPLYVLFIDIDPARIDINVHPTKQEIKFDDERIIYTFLQASVKRALAQYSVTPTLDFKTETAFDREGNFGNWMTGTNHSHNENEKSFSSYQPLRQDPNLPNWKELYNIASKPNEPTQAKTIEANWKADKTANEKLNLEDFSDKPTPPFQLHLQYIVSQIKSGFILVDQQAAHERILFEKYLNAIEQNKPGNQQQLFPLTMHVNAADFDLIKEILPEINALGFDLQEFGKDAFVIHGIPPDLPQGSEVQMIEKLLEGFRKTQTEVKLDKRQQVARNMARNASIKRGQKLSESEMKNLLDQLFACETPFQTSDGRMTFITFGLNDLEKQFSKK